MNWKNNFRDFPTLVKFTNRLLIVLIICFPFYMWFGGWNCPHTTAMYLISAGGLRWITKPMVTMDAVDWLMGGFPVAFGLLVLIFGSRIGLYYPVVINLGLLLIFYSSLSTPTNFIQRIAENMENRPLDAIGMRYTGYVTRVWCLLFLLNATFAMFFAWQQMLVQWTLYNGIFAYLLIGLLLLGERLLRHSLQRKMLQAGNG